MSAVAVFQASHAEHLREALRAHDAGLPVFLGNPHWACLLYTSPSPRD